MATVFVHVASFATSPRAHPSPGSRTSRWHCSHAARPQGFLFKLFERKWTLFGAKVHYSRRVLDLLILGVLASMAIVCKYDIANHKDVRRSRAATDPLRIVTFGYLPSLTSLYV